MEYPGSHFKRPVRLSLLILFIAAFLVIAPICVLYTTGYRYDWKNGLLRETGSVSIDIEPKTTVAYLDGLKLDQSMPIRLKNITPQKYLLRLASPGYYDFVKEITVEDKKTTYIKEISLLKKSEPTLLVKSNKIDSVSLSYDGAYIAYFTHEPEGQVLWLAGTSNTSAVKIATLPETPFTISWAPTTDFLSVANTNRPYTLLETVDARNPHTVTLASPGAITDYQWNSDNDPELIYSTKTAINVFNPQTRQTTLIGQNNYDSWYLDHGALWTLTEATTTPGMLVLTSNTLGFSTNFAAIAPSSAANGPWSIRFAENKTVLLQNSNHTAMLLVTPTKVYPLTTTNILVSPYNDWWLLWSPSELWTYSNGSDPALLERSGEPLVNVAPLDQYNTLALSWHTKTSALYPYYFTGNDFLQSSITSLAADSKNKMVYFTDKEGLWKLSY